MATKFRQNITGELTQELLAAGSNIRVSSISLCNIHASTTCTVDIYIEKVGDGTYYITKGVALPVGVTLVQDNITFDNSSGEYGLYIKLTKGASETPAVDVILS
tara:strand:+ start:477 stop:788 length:312 start_codon:yes stop_codon:yes gene_type:complete